MITARVIRIISTKQLIFNAGEQDGVRRGQRFRVHSQPESIIDPDSGELLGEYRVTKVTVEPDRVFPRFTIASQPYRYESDDPSDDSYAEWPDLPVDPTEIAPLGAHLHVTVGDFVELLEEDLSPPADDDVPF